LSYIFQKGGIMQNRETAQLTDPPFLVSLFNNRRWAWIWTITRLYLAYVWINAGWAKVGNPAWMETGAALKGFWTNAVKIPDPAHPTIAYDWYRWFIQSLLNAGAYVWFAKLIALGELLVGVALLLGFLTGVTAFLAGFMNWNYMMAGSAGVNPALFVLALLLVLAWKTAGWWGLDRWILPRVAALWAPKRLPVGKPG
jgi:thiosulfate dehydrogenase [quinone] large subunit